MVKRQFFFKLPGPAQTVEVVGWSPPSPLVNTKKKRK